MNSLDAYEVVVGLEVHAQLSTISKLFCGDATSFGAPPNTHISPITMGQPGTLPMLNKKAVAYAIAMGLACECSITEKNYFARKHYFYPDLPKGYQLSQHTTPVCAGGFIIIPADKGAKKIRLNRIHLEEDAGKSIHDIDQQYTCIDLNRAGVPLIEIVSEPDMRSGAEAYAFLTEIRKLVRYLDICDGNMEEGSLRCDANISIRKKGVLTLGTKVEVKNLNSIRNVKRAIEYEAERMIALAESGQSILQETRSYDAASTTTFALRSKEEANDYRYFTDPDIAPFQVGPAWLAAIKDTLPELPNKRLARYQEVWGLSAYDAGQLTEEKASAEYFEALLHVLDQTSPGQTQLHAKQAANWITGPIKSYLNENTIPMEQFPLPPSSVAQLIQLTQRRLINFSQAAGIVMHEMMASGREDAMQVVHRLNMAQESDAGVMEKYIEEVLASMPEKVIEYKKGKKGLIGLFIGEVKKRSAGKADPQVVNDLLLKKLSS